MSQFFIIKNNMVFVMAQIKVNACENKILGIHNNKIKIAINAIKSRNEANSTLIIFLSKLLELKQSQIIIKTGLKNVNKVLMLPNTKNVMNFLNTIDESYAKKNSQ